jgi:hypothetical protein
VSRISIKEKKESLNHENGQLFSCVVTAGLLLAEERALSHLIRAAETGI